MENDVCTEISRFITDSPANLLPDRSGPYFSQPLVGYADLDDPLFTDYKTIIGDFHLTPRELFRATLGEEPPAGTVICWVLPVAPAVRQSNQWQSDLPSRQWAQTRTNGEALNSQLRRHLVAWLEGRGQRAVAPQLAALWREVPASPVGRASTWSERHAAYAAGLGTFSLNDGLITARGIAHRCGSIITDLVLPTSPRRVGGHAHNCLYHREGSCGACIGRCPVGAISWSGHDKERCGTYVYQTVPAAVGEAYGVTATGCGLCQTRVPCESGIPRGRGSSGLATSGEETTIPR
jgi:epoxyqueuosine reductase QueG